MEAVIDGERYALNRLDKRGARELAEINAESDPCRRADLQWSWLSRQLERGGDAVREVAGGDDADGCDLVALEVAFCGACRAYDEPISRAKLDALRGQMEGIDLGQMERLLALASQVGSRQGFKRAR